jgi:MSHA biogenesis protein MshP
MMRSPARHGQEGFALIGALCVLVVLAALGAFAVRATMTQQHSAVLELQELRAEAAVSTGVEYAAARLLTTTNCGSLTNLNNVAGGFAVAFNNCVRTQYTVNLVNVFVYTVDVTAAQGVYGTPDFVSRTVRVRVTT